MLSAVFQFHQAALVFIISVIVQAAENLPGCDFRGSQRITSISAERGGVIFFPGRMETVPMLPEGILISTTSSTPLKSDTVDNRALVQTVVLLVLALQMPSLREIVELLELHLHSFPVLVVLGVFRGMFARKNKIHNNDDDLASGTASNLLSSSPTLAQIEDYYNNNNNNNNNTNVQNQEPMEDAPLSPAAVRSTTPDLQTADQWGYFADFDEVAQDLPPSASVSSLSPLQEMDDEEDE